MTAIPICEDAKRARRIFKRAVAVLLGIVLICGSLGCAGGNADSTYDEKDTENYSKPTGLKKLTKPAEDEAFQEVAAVGNYRLSVDVKSGEFVIENTTTGASWRSNPLGKENDEVAKGIQKTNLLSQLILTFIDQKKRTEQTPVNTYAQSSNKGDTACYAIPNGFRMVYTIKAKGFSIPLEITLGDGFFEARIPVREITEKEEENISSISLLPYFAAAGSDEAGYMLVPDGSGSLIYYNNGKTYLGEYNQKVYGPDYAYISSTKPAVTQNINLPVFGANSGKTGYFAVMISGAAQASIVCSTSGVKNSYNYVYPAYRLRGGDTYNIGSTNLTKFSQKMDEVEDIRVRYYLLEDDCSYAKMADIYKGYLLETGMQTREREDNAPLFIELLGAIKKKTSVLGIPVKFTKPMTTYAGMLELLKKLRQKIPGKIIVKYSYADGKSLSGEYPEYFDWNKRLGSAKEREELLSYCEKNNIELLPNINLLSHKKSTLKTMTFFNAVRSVSGSQSIICEYLLNTRGIDYSVSPSYLMSPLKFLDYLPGLLTSLDKNGVKGISADTLGQYLYSDYNEKRAVSREQAAKKLSEAAKSISDTVQTLMLSNANAYMLPFADYVEDVPQEHSAFFIADESVPFYQMSVNGLVEYSSTAVNFSSDTTEAFLRALETGSSLKYNWACGDVTLLQNTTFGDLYALDAQAWLENCLSFYEAYNSIYKATDGMDISSHELLAEGVHRTHYRNGASLFINYNETAFTTESGETVGPRSYLLVRAD